MAHEELIDAKDGSFLLDEGVWNMSLSKLLVCCYGLFLSLLALVQTDLQSVSLGASVICLTRLDFRVAPSKMNCSLELA